MNQLELILIVGKIDSSSNYPLEIWAIDEKGNKGKYIFKPFRQDVINIYPTAKEIICSEIAYALDLPVPKYDIINIDDSTLNLIYTENEIRRFYKGYKFCSKKLEQYSVFVPHASVGFLKEYGLASIFAFDVLVQNTDRGQRGKPNLIQNDNSIAMIDHELTFWFINSGTQNTNYQSHIANYQHQKHTLIKHLKSIREKNHIFDEFFENLYRFDVNSLSSVFDDLDKFNIEYGSRNDYILYLNWCKKTSLF